MESENKQFYKVSTTLQLVPTSGTFDANTFSADDVITDASGTTATVISYTLNTSTSASLEITGLTGTFAVNTTLSKVQDTNIATNATIDDIVDPEILPYYGDVIYIQNVTPVVATNDSEEHIKVIIKF